jgi:hypothetical protein
MATGRASPVPISSLIGRWAKCPVEGCGLAGPVSEGRNLASALGSTARPPVAGAHFPYGSIRVEYPPLGVPWHTPTAILDCPRHPRTAYLASHMVEPAPDAGQEVSS